MTVSYDYPCTPVRMKAQYIGDSKTVPVGALRTEVPANRFFSYCSAKHYNLVINGQMPNSFVEPSSMVNLFVPSCSASKTH